MKAVREGSAQAVLGMLEELDRSMRKTSTTTDKKKAARGTSSLPSSAPFSRKELGKNFPDRGGLTKLLRFPYDQLGHSQRFRCRRLQSARMEGRATRPIYYITTNFDHSRKENPRLRSSTERASRCSS